MNKKNLSNKPASIRQRLLNHAKATRQDFQRVVDGYAIECILDRLAQSTYADRFLLKGALLFSVWKGLGNRPTRDIDLLGKDSDEIDSLVQTFKEIVSIEVKDDGLLFFPEKIGGLRIKKEDSYQGVRILIDGSLSGAIFKVQIDIGFGDAVNPSPKLTPFPRMLSMKPFSMLMYPPETVFAEKLEAIVSLGMPNSRMKDYYDLSILIHENLVKINSTRTAIKKTFERRKTSLPISCPIGLSGEFAHDATKTIQWKGFLKKSGLDGGNLIDVVVSIRKFVVNVLEVKWE